MKKKLQRPPSHRNVEIFYDVVSRGKKQVEVARQYHLSEPRVSQIVGQVRRYTATVKPLLSATPEQQTYYFCDIYGAALVHYERLSADTFVEQHKWCRAAEAEEQPRRPPRADARLITTAVGLVKEQKANCLEQIAAGEKCKEAHRREQYRKAMAAQVLTSSAEIAPKSCSSEELPTDFASSESAGQAASAAPLPPETAPATAVVEQVAEEVAEEVKSVVEPRELAAVRREEKAGASSRPMLAPLSGVAREKAVAGPPVGPVDPPPRRSGYWFGKSDAPKPPPKPRDPNVIIWHSMRE